MISFLLTMFVLGWFIYLRRVAVAQAMWLWQQVADNHPSQRARALAKIAMLERLRFALGWMIFLHVLWTIWSLSALFNP